jgi:hypothetical protein
VAVPPIQIEISAPALTAGNGSVVMEIKSISVQLFSEATKVYVVLDVGEATGFEIFGLFKLDAGDQLYVAPPLPFNVVLKPGQTVTSAPAFATGGGPKAIRTLSVLLQVVVYVDTSVYVVAAVGEATGFAIVVLLNPEEGLHK